MNDKHEEKEYTVKIELTISEICALNTAIDREYNLIKNAIKNTLESIGDRELVPGKDDRLIMARDHIIPIVELEVRDLYSIRSKVGAVLAENDGALSLEDIHGLAQI